MPRWMRFAPPAYTDRGGVGTVSAAERLAGIRAGLDEPAADAECSAADLDTPDATGIASLSSDAEADRLVA